MDKNNNYTVYMHVFPNNKVYIGLTRNKPERRWGTNGNGYETQYVYNAILKYGWDNIEHVIISTNLSSGEACKLEQDLIEQYDSIKNGYNCSPGGETNGGIPKYYEYHNKRYSIYELLEDKNINIYNISYDCSKWRINTGWSLEDIFNTPQPEKYNYYEYNEKKYTIYELANISTTGITPHGIQTRIRRGYSVKDAVEKQLTEKTMYREYNGEYYTCDELAEKFGHPTVDGHTIVTRLQHGWTVERAVSQPKGTKLQPFGIKEPTYEYKGKMYNSYELSQIHPELGLKSVDITTRINHHHWDIERAVSQPKKKRGLLFEYEGKQYNSHELTEICVDKSIKYHDVTSRARNNWTTWEIVNIPKGVTKKQFYKMKK